MPSCGDQTGVGRKPGSSSQCRAQFALEACSCMLSKYELSTLTPTSAGPSVAQSGFGQSAPRKAPRVLRMTLRHHPANSSQRVIYFEKSARYRNVWPIGPRRGLNTEAIHHAIRFAVWARARF